MNLNEKLKECLFLFDIDGTILDMKGDGKKAIISSIESSLGVKITDEISLLGGIDCVFFRYYYDLYNFPAEKYDFYWKLFTGIYIEIMNGYNKENWQIFPKSYESIEFLYRYSNIALTTGNMKEGAEIKLKRFDLNAFFKAGGFGDTNGDRALIVQDAVRSSELLHNKKFDKNKIYLFGDTYKDVKSAIDNQITPVLIDPKKINRENAEKWKAGFYGDFSFFDNFLKVFEDNNKSKVIFFD
jgi:phosphoglycolate phosphatase